MDISKKTSLWYYQLKLTNVTIFVDIDKLIINIIHWMRGNNINDTSMNRNGDSI